MCRRCWKTKPRIILLGLSTLPCLGYYCQVRKMFRFASESDKLDLHWFFWHSGYWNGSCLSGSWINFGPEFSARTLLELRLLRRSSDLFIFYTAPDGGAISVDIAVVDTDPTYMIMFVFYLYITPMHLLFSKLSENTAKIFSSPHSQQSTRA